MTTVIPAPIAVGEIEGLIRPMEGEWRGRYAYAAEILVDLTRRSADDVIRASEARIRAAAKAESAKKAEEEAAKKGPFFDFDFGVAS